MLAFYCQNAHALLDVVGPGSALIQVSALYVTLKLALGKKKVKIAPGGPESCKEDAFSCICK